MDETAQRSARRAPLLELLPDPTEPLALSETPRGSSRPNFDVDGHHEIHTAVGVAEGQRLQPRTTDVELGSMRHRRWSIEGDTGRTGCHVRSRRELENLDTVVPTSWQDLNLTMIDGMGVEPKEVRVIVHEVEDFDGSSLDAD